ncbi:hypothetical protein TanjilG_15874 [Lupinus angustifolius]|uniref:Uncharacterized protein n=1 Tax=Lupinus angustifolius TaxID=3871 RepID=A0A1J7G5K9_LUPAN|nr:PREDICTED: uncharacterized protein LOC109340931 [Lupinus angustifolius]OIV89601.1 hypothetical protein TanjilG_15874 [Lupinus angustifolius]
MADLIPYTTKTHSPFSTIKTKPINKGNSFSPFIFKVLFFALFLIAVPLFPSQAPHFVNQTLLTKFWDLIHLLFIGIAVAYGLFSRRNVEHEIIEIETESSVVCGTDSYVSKMFPVSTIFDENENPCGFDEKRVMHCWNPQYFDGGAVDVFDEQFETQLPISEDNFNCSVGFDGTTVVQAWNSENYESEPVVVVAQPCYTIGECGEAVGYKPLGLPVRSLRLVSEGVDGVIYSNESDSSSGSKGSCKSSVKSRDREFRDIGPSFLERKFNNDAAAGGASASPVPWCSRSRKMGREKGYGNVTHPMHLRPYSVDETKFGALGSGPLPSITPFSSHVAMYSSLNSTSSNNMNFYEVEVGKEEASYVPASEKMNFQEEDLRQENTSFVPGSENMNFEEEDFRESKTSYVPGSENLIFQEVDLGKKKLQGSSSRNGRMATKRKHAAASYPSHFKPTSVVETQFASLTSRSFQSVESLSLHPSMYSSFDSSISDNVNFQEEDIEQKKTFPMHSSENMHFRGEYMGQKNTFYAHASENMNFQEENLRQRKTRNVPTSENMNFLEEGMVLKKTSYVHASENVNFQEENLRQRKRHYVPASENMNFQEEEMDLKKTSYVHASENANFREEILGQGKTSYVPASEKMCFDEEKMGQKKTFYVHASENMIFQEENMGQQKISSVPASENMNFQEVDLRKISRKPSSRNGRRETKGKSAAVSNPSHFRPISGDETQFEEGNVNFRDDNLGQKKTCYVTGSENMNFEDGDLGKNIPQGPSSSRNGRMETNRKSAAASHPSHIRSTSVDEPQFESLSSRSFQYMGSFSSRMSLSSSSSSENMNLQKEEFGENKSSHGSSSTSSSPPNRKNNDPIYSNESLLQGDIQSNLGDNSGDFNETRGEEDRRGNKKSGMHAMLSDSEKLASLPKIPSRGKSVRTRRASGLSLGLNRTGEVSSKQTDEKVEKKPNTVEAASARKDKMESEEPDFLLKAASKKTLDSYCPPKPEVIFSNRRIGDKLEPSKNVSDEDSNIELENIQLSSDEDVVSEHVNDSGLDSEVDKKASEFIAKFKAQIRLQKMGSIDGSKGQKTIRNFVR